MQPPDPDRLQRTSSDDWARLLPAIRGALHDVAREHDDDEAARLADTSFARLAAGRGRDRLIARLAVDGPVWAALARRLDPPTLPSGLRWLVEPGAEAPDTPRDAAPGSSAGDPRQRRRDRERLRDARDERDRARRRAEGAEVRAAAAEAKVAELEAALGRAHDRIADLRAALADADRDRDRVVERERRRAAAEIAGLREDLRRLRRDEERRRQAARREDDPSRQAPPTGGPRARPAAGGRPGVELDVPDRPIPGRPTRLPASIHRGTTAEVEALLHRGRLVLVDGYNLSRQHRGHLRLHEQRDWLVRHLTGLAARRGVQVEVVFDGQVASAGARAGQRSRDVQVSFTPAGVTADDEIVFAVEALPLDRPVTVVTDDQGLRARLRPYQVDLLHTTPFLLATS